MCSRRRERTGGGDNVNTRGLTGASASSDFSDPNLFDGEDKIARVSHCEKSLLPSHDTSLLQNSGCLLSCSPNPSNLGWGLGNLEPRSDRVPALGGLVPQLWSLCGLGTWEVGEAGVLEEHLHVVPALASLTPAAAHPAPGYPEPISQAQNKRLLGNCRLLPRLNSKTLPGFFFVKRLPQHAYSLLNEGLSHSALGVRTLQALWALHSLLPEDCLGRELSFTDPWP